LSDWRRKMEILHDLKSFLEGKGFCEVITQILRKEEGNLSKRIAVDNFGFLRESHELLLRYTLAEYESVYEIGSCFRNEVKGSSTNLPEFLLLELFTKKYNICELRSMLEQFILLSRPEIKFEEISVAVHIKENVGIDLFVSPQNLLYRKLREKYSNENFEHDYEYVNHYITKEVEPMTKQGNDICVFLTQYPECTCSYADTFIGSNGNIINRFELFINGLEVVNGFDDECDSENFIRRNEKLPMFPIEEEYIAAALKNGVLPQKSAGLGIGIERLCALIERNTDVNQLGFMSDLF